VNDAPAPSLGQGEGRVDGHGAHIQHAVIALRQRQNGNPRGVLANVPHLRPPLGVEHALVEPEQAIQVLGEDDPLRLYVLERLIEAARQQEKFEADSYGQCNIQ